MRERIAASVHGRYGFSMRASGSRSRCCTCCMRARPTGCGWRRSKPSIAGSSSTMPKRSRRQPKGVTPDVPHWLAANPRARRTIRRRAMRRSQSCATRCARSMSPASRDSVTSRATTISYPMRNRCRPPRPAMRSAAWCGPAGARRPARLRRSGCAARAARSRRCWRRPTCCTTNGASIRRSGAARATRNSPATVMQPTGGTCCIRTTNRASHMCADASATATPVLAVTGYAGTSPRRSGRSSRPASRRSARIWPAGGARAPNARWIAAVALRLLADDGRVPADWAAQAMRRYASG